MREAALEEMFSRMEQEWTELPGNGFLMEPQKQQMQIALRKFRSKFKVKKNILNIFVILPVLGLSLVSPEGHDLRGGAGSARPAGDLPSCGRPQARPVLLMFAFI